MNENISFFKIITKVYPIAYSAASRFFVVWMFMAVMFGVLIGAQTFFMANFFDSVSRAAAEQSGILTPILAAVVLGAVIIGVNVLNGIVNFMNNSFFQIADGHMSGIINAKVGRIDPVVFENPEFLDNINKAVKGGQNSLNFVLVFTTLINFYLPYFIFMAAYLFFLKPLLVLAIVIIFIPSFLNQIIRAKIFAKLEDKSAPIRRETDYYSDCITSRELYKETRLLGAIPFFNRLFMSSLNKLLKEVWRTERKSGLLELLMEIISLLGYCGVLLLLVDTMLKGEISTGSFAAVFMSIGGLRSMMRQIVNYHIGNISKNIGTVKNIIRFLDLPEKTGTATEYSFDEGIVLENVSFTYPKSEKPSITGLNLTIKPKETIAVVGVNGAGKSTLVKLIMGLYTPETGSVKYGNADTKDLSASVIYSDISAVFQSYGQYKLTLRENITISDMNSKNGIETPAKNADVEISSKTFPDGGETVLSKEFNGVDISGGEWQRVAIARGLYREHKIIVLDEPTSAIDPIEETRLYQKFAEISKDVISVIVTHRLGSARIADRIIVIDDGKIAETGSHESLLANKKKYAELWEAQAQYYV